MTEFFGKYPEVAYYLLGLLVICIGALLKILVGNNTIAMNNIVTAVASLTTQIEKVDIKFTSEIKEIKSTQIQQGQDIARHDVQLSKEK